MGEPASSGTCPPHLFLALALQVIFTESAPWWPQTPAPVVTRVPWPSLPGQLVLFCPCPPPRFLPLHTLRPGSELLTSTAQDSLPRSKALGAELSLIVLCLGALWNESCSPGSGGWAGADLCVHLPPPTGKDRARCCPQDAHSQEVDQEAAKHSLSWAQFCVYFLCPPI